MMVIERGRAERRRSLHGWGPWGHDTIQMDNITKKENKLWLPAAQGMGSMKDMRIQVRVLKDKKCMVQERTIIMDRMMPSSLWTVREVRVDQPFDGTVEPDAEYCILARPSRLSQHLLHAMRHERRDKVLRRWVPLGLVAIVFAIIACLVWGCGSSRCFISWLLSAWTDLTTTFDCVLQEKPCPVRSVPGPWFRDLEPESNIKLLLLFGRLIWFCAMACFYLFLLGCFWGSFIAWVRPLLASFALVREDEDVLYGRLRRHSTNVPRESMDSMRPQIGSPRDGLSSWQLSPNSQPLSPAVSHHLHSPMGSSDGMFSPGKGFASSFQASPGRARAGFSPASRTAVPSTQLLFRGRGGRLGATQSTPGGWVDGDLSLHSALAVAGNSGVGSPNTHAFGTHAFGVSFNEEVTVHTYAVHSDSRLSASPMKPVLTPIPPKECSGLTPMLPTECRMQFDRYSSSLRTSRRTGLTEAEADLRRKISSPLSRASIQANKGSLGPLSPSSASVWSTMNNASGGSMVQTGWAAGAWSGKGLSMLSPLSLSLSLSGKHVDRWWLEKPDGACDYCSRILSESGTKVLFCDSRTRNLAPEINLSLMTQAEALLEQTAHGMRRWIGCHVLRHVIDLLDKVDKDAARGLGTRPATAPAAAAALPALGAAGGFGLFASAPLQPPPPPLQKTTREVEAEDRKLQVKAYTSLKRYAHSADLRHYVTRRIKELWKGGVDPDVLGYVWDGGSTQEYEELGNGSVVANDPSRPDPHLGYSASSISRPGVSALDSPGARGRRVWPCNGTRARPTDSELLMHLVATFLDFRHRGPVCPTPAAAAGAAAGAAPGAAAPGGGFGAAGGGAFGAPWSAKAPAAANGFGAPAAFGAPAVGGSFGVPAARPAVSSAAAGNTVKLVKFFTTEHFIAYLPADKQTENSRRPVSNRERPQLARREALNTYDTHQPDDFKQRPIVVERFHDDETRFPHYFDYIVHLDRAKHTVLNHGGQIDGQRIWKVAPRPGPDNLFHMLAVLAIELKVHYKGKLGLLDLSHPALNLMSFVPLEVQS